MRMLFAILVVVVMCGARMSTAASLPDIWFSPVDNMPRGPNQVRFTPDYPDLFSVDSNWPKASSHVRAFVLAAGYVVGAKDEELARIFVYLKSKNIALVVGISPLSSPGTCGFHVEGYSALGEPISIAMRVKKLGGDLRFMGMDEPLFYGHFFKGPNACRSPIPVVAHDAARAARDVRSIFPHVLVGEAEPSAAIPPEALHEWLDAFQEAYGERLAFYDMDVPWEVDWKAGTLESASVIRRNSISLGIIYNGDSRSKSDIEWLDSAARNFQIYETSGAPLPDTAIIGTWTKLPSHALPETDPTAFTSLINRYVLWRQSRRFEYP
jgi:hypothetical protein